ncbi:MAG: basic amino acid/polyamine antiporter [Muribaculaceae bacterium]|nr:basic amino acid/polyamine antiporter [Muribaculaceae bacterium]
MSESRGISHRLGFWGLTGIVFGSVIGGSIFNLAQTLARNAALGAVISAWLITGVGILFLVLTFKRLADARPDLKAGIYQYAQEGFGNYMGFNMAWGYWLCVILGNVTYAVMINDSLGAFLSIFRDNPAMTFFFGTALVWLMFGIVSQGVQSAAFVNTLLSLLKFACIILIIGVLAVYVKVGLFTQDFWGHASVEKLGSVGNQFSSCMLVTIWSFLGIEGAVMMAGRARHPKDVGRATVVGFLLALTLYILISILCFGVMTQPDMASLPNPSLAYVLDSCAGAWAKWFVILSVIISLTGGFVAWTLVCAQVPYEAAAVKIFPRQFLRLNRKGMPWFGMGSATTVMTLCLLLVVTAENIYVAALNLTALMVLPPYLFCGLYLWKLTTTVDGHRALRGKVEINRFIAAAEVAFCLYIMWAGTFRLLMVTSIFYVLGVVFFMLARIQNSGRLFRRRDIFHPIRIVGGVFTKMEFALFLTLVVMAVVSVILLANGYIRLDV